MFEDPNERLAMPLSGSRCSYALPRSQGPWHFYHDPDGRLLAESADTGIPEREYVWLPLDGQAWALPLAMISDAGTASPRLHYIHSDHLGTPVAMTSGGLGQLEWSAVLRPFGEVQAITGTQDLALRFPGQFFDAETGFHQNWHRDYDPRLGRYLQSDPIGLEGGLNTYAYGGGNPINMIDPSGENPATGALWGGNIGTGVGGALGGPVGALVGRLLGTTLGVAAGYCAVSFAMDDGAEEERCKKVVDECRRMCSDQFAENPGSLPGVGHDYFGRLRRCIRECIEVQGCSY